MAYSDIPCENDATDFDCAKCPKQDECEDKIPADLGEDDEMLEA